MVARNVTKAADHRKKSQSGIARTALEAHQTTIGRLMAGERDFRISSLQAAAEGLGYEPWQFLVPDFDPADPPRLIPQALKGYLK